MFALIPLAGDVRPAMFVFVRIPLVRELVVKFKFAVVERIDHQDGPGGDTRDDNQLSRHCVAAVGARAAVVSLKPEGFAGVVRLAVQWLFSYNTCFARTSFKRTLRSLRLIAVSAEHVRHSGHLHRVRRVGETGNAVFVVILEVVMDGVGHDFRKSPCDVFAQFIEVTDSHDSEKTMTRKRTHTDISNHPRTVQFRHIVIGDVLRDDCSVRRTD